MKKILFLFMFLSFLNFFTKNNHANNKMNDSRNSDYLKSIMAGNEKFLQQVDKDVLAKTSIGQTPEAVVISCSDSRVYAEKIFNKEIGDLFVIRTAGHVVGYIALQSVEFAVKELGVRKIIILGHTKCGAVKATMNEMQNNNIKAIRNNAILQFIAKSYKKIKKNCDKCSCTEDELYEKIISMNVFRTSNYLLENSQIIKELLKEKKLEILHLIYNVETGKVDALDRNEIQICKNKNKNSNIGFEEKIAPNFEINNKLYKGSLLDFYSKEENQDKYIVLYFYPKDNTPGCTIQAKKFRDLQETMENEGIYTIGVSMDDKDSHEDFIKSKKLNFQLISDNGALVESYGVKNNNSLTKLFIPTKRTTFIIGYSQEDKVPKIKHIFENAPVFSNAQDSLDKIRELRKAKK